MKFVFYTMCFNINLQHLINYITDRYLHRWTKFTGKHRVNKKNKTKKIKDDRVNNISWIELVVKYTQKKSGTNAHTKEPRGRRC